MTLPLIPAEVKPVSDTPLTGTNSAELRVDGRWFKDEHGRVVMLRGVNLSGNAKMPYTPYMPTHIERDFFDHQNISFVGRPFPLTEAEEHFARLKHWGFTFLRFCITWEALEHAGP
jgi:hypothetical protein